MQLVKPKRKTEMTDKQLQYSTSYFYKEKQKGNASIHLRQPEGRGIQPSPDHWNRDSGCPTVVKPSESALAAYKNNAALFQRTFGTIDKRLSSSHWSKVNYVVVQNGEAERNKNDRVIHAIGEGAYKVWGHTNEIMHPVQRYRHRVYGGCHNAVDSVPNATK